jgi:hypothetical protein
VDLLSEGGGRWNTAYGPTTGDRVCICKVQREGLEGQGAGLDPLPKDQRAVQGCRCEIGHFEVIVAEEQEHQRTTYSVPLAGFSTSLANNMS